MPHLESFYFKSCDPCLDWKAPRCLDDEINRLRSPQNERLEAFLDRRSVCYVEPAKLGIVRPERNYITYEPSAEIVENFQREFNRAIGSPLFRWMSGLTLSEEEASSLVEEALYGALSGLADILRKGRQVGEHIALDELLHDLLVGGIATRLARLAAPEANRIAQSIILDFKKTLQTGRIHADGAFVYVEKGTLYIGLTDPVTMGDIIANPDDWEMRPVRL
jgi:hypothetical protein